MVRYDPHISEGGIFRRYVKFYTFPYSHKNLYPRVQTNTTNTAQRDTQGYIGATIDLTISDIILDKT